MKCDEVREDHSFMTKKNSPVVVSTHASVMGEDSDIFENITVDRAFTENTLKDAQKVSLIIYSQRCLFS